MTNDRDRAARDGEEVIRADRAVIIMYPHRALLYVPKNYEGG